MTFDEVVEIIWGNTLGIDASDEPGKKDFIIKDDMVATGREALTFLISELKDTYAPTIEMTENQKNAFDEAKQALNTRDLASNFSQEWTILDEVSGNVFGHGPDEATNEQIEAIMQAWLHPETIKVVDDD
ncbi:hypothetical protein AB0Y21_00250 [Weissella paramesenteroides]|uniref:hypothetical protein n=1 Tax=Weissella paramesenteroides TaxID=1249 RepID=UPI003F220AB4